MITKRKKKCELRGNCSFTFSRMFCLSKQKYKIVRVKSNISFYNYQPCKLRKNKLKARQSAWPCDYISQSRKKKIVNSREKKKYSYHK